MILALGLILAGGADTIRVAALPAGTPIERISDSTRWGPPVARWQTGDRLWLLRDSVAVAVVVWRVDTTRSFSDRVTITLDTEGDRAADPQHDDFAWEFHRTIDSSVIFRGRDGRWQPPRDDPDWRLGAEREGGGWHIQVREETGGWLLILRLDPEYFTQASNAFPGLAVATYDDGSRWWLTWPSTPPGVQPAGITDHPNRWGSVQP